MDIKLRESLPEITTMTTYDTQDLLDQSKGVVEVNTPPPVSGRFKCCGGNDDPEPYKTHCQDCPDLCLFYSPELDMINICTRSDGFMFKDADGEFHLNYLLNDREHPFKTYRFDFIGELGPTSDEDDAA